jgi:hypothetical protein
VNVTLLKKPVFWIVLLIASALCVFTVLRFFGDAFSVLDLDVRMSRTMAIDGAKRINDTKKLTTATLTEAVASFGGDSGSQTFIELEGGGKPALKPLLGDDEFTLYKWRVRLFAPSVEREVLIAFTPDGRPSGFLSKLPEAEPGAALSSDDARAIAVTSAAKDWNVDFARYRPLTASATTRPGKRVDHEFVYERKLEGAPPIGDGRLRLRMVVAGDRLMQLQRYIYVPEAFARRYETVRSVNNIIASAASVVAGLVYGLGGCLIGLIWLMRRHAVRWAPSAKWAAVVALLIMGSGLASVSGSWFSYDTATSASTHVIARIGFALVGGVVTWLLLTVVFATAEGLGRVAFGTHPQLWRAWHRPAANSREIWGRTLAGYAWIGFDLAFIAIFYFLVQRYLGWWSPSDALIDPNILGTPQPWIGPVSMALQAGMMEESLFRAIPLAGAALLGRWFKREKLFIIVALVLQAIVFGCAHANYPGQPAYARPIELFAPSLVWGIVYLRFGLVPGMLFHFGFDLVLMSIPLFVTDAPGVLFDRAMVIGIAALPLIVLTVQRLRAGRLIDLPDSERNAAGMHAPPETRAAEEAVLEVVDEVKEIADAVLHPSSVSKPAFARRDVAVLVVIAIVGIVGLVTRVTLPFDAPGLTIGRDEALAIAERALAARGVKLDARWHRSVKAFGISDPAGSHFLWHEGGSAAFASLLDKTIAPPHWEVRFARFDGDVTERESWRVSLVDDRPAPEGIRLIEHDIPEAKAGKRLTEAEARPLAEVAIADWLKVHATGLRPVSAQAIERPARVDWLFVYADPAVAVPAGGEARIGVEIDGDEVVSLGRSLFVPDAWKREQRSLDEKLTIPRYVLGVLGLAIAIAGLVSLVRRLARGEASKRAAWVTALLIVVTLLAGALLDLNASQFTFTIAEPFDNQMLGGALRLLGVTAAGALFGALIAAVGVRMASRVDADAGSNRMPLQRWAAPLAVALLVAGVGGLAAWFGPALDPRVPSVGAADSIAPWLNALIGELDFPASASLALLAVALLSSRKRAMQIVIAVAFIAAAMLGRAATRDATVGAIVGAGVAGAIGWLIYRTQIRDRLWVVAPLMLCLALIGEATSLFNAPYPGSRLATIMAIVATLIGYRIWQWLIGRDERVSRSS